MISVYPAARARTFVFDYQDESGTIVAPVSASYALYDELDAAVVASTSITIVGVPTSASITINAAANTLTDQRRGFRKLALSFSDVAGTGYVLEQNYVLEQPGLVETGENSFDTYGGLILLSQSIVNLEAFHEASIRDQRAALINAWYNIGDVPLINLGLDEEYQAHELTSELLALLDVNIRTQLKRAQIIEANFILGGNPIEDRRRTGMISDSSGESTQFFRTSRPVELPICKAAANALRGRVDWSLKISR